MDFVEGKELEQIVRNKGPMKGKNLRVINFNIDREAKKIIRQILEGVKYMHS